jgi:hypothetical protein
MAQVKKYSVIVKKLNVLSSTVIALESIRLVTDAIVMGAVILNNMKKKEITPFWY